jgi:photosystem II stability/assembly factor-like uncharacterized protein
MRHVPAGTGSASVFDVSFVNGLVGKAIGTLCQASCGWAVWGTNNGGQTWRIERRSQQTQPNFQAIFCSDARHCWAAGRTTNREAVWATVDGSTWKSEPTPFIQDAILYDITCAATHPARCWAVGGNSRPTGVILRTIDGGATWTRQLPPRGVDVVQQAQAIGPGLGWAVAPSEETNDWIIATTTGGLAP